MSASAPHQAGDGQAGAVEMFSVASRADLGPYIPRLSEIFFACSSVQQFATEGARAAFFERWVAHYLETCWSDVILGFVDGRMVGYLTGCRDSAKATGMFERLPSYSLFQEAFADFPAHLHVNVDATVQGRGVGRELVEAFVARCRGAGLAGVHIVTDAAARNISFYERLGFSTRLERPFRSMTLLLMGQRLCKADIVW